MTIHTMLPYIFITKKLHCYASLDVSWLYQEDIDSLISAYIAYAKRYA